MYAIKFVSDDALPDDHDFALVQTSQDVVVFFRESRLSPQVLEDSWAAYRSLQERPALYAVS